MKGTKKTLQSKLPHIASQFDQIWNKNLENMYVARDFVRLASSFDIEVEDNPIEEDSRTDSNNSNKNEKTYTNITFRENTIEQAEDRIEIIAETLRGIARLMRGDFNIEPYPIQKKKIRENHEANGNKEQQKEGEEGATTKGIIINVQKKDQIQFQKQQQKQEQEGEEEGVKEKVKSLDEQMLSPSSSSSPPPAAEEELNEKEGEEEGENIAFIKVPENDIDQEDDKEAANKYEKIDKNEQALPPCISVDSFRKELPTINETVALTNYLVRTYGDFSPFMKLLKMCDQAYVVCLLGHLGNLLWEQANIRFKDVRGTWRVIVRKKKDHYSVIHRRKEHMIKVENNIRIILMFQFQWEVEVEFDKELKKIEQVNVRILGIDWNPSSIPKSPKEVQKLYDTIGKDPTLRNASEAIRDYRQQQAKKLEELQAAEATEAASPTKKQSSVCQCVLL